MKGWSAVLLQVGVLLAVASALGLGANRMRGDKNRVDLTRNYFPKFRSAPPREPTPNQAGAEAREPTPPDHGLQVMSFEQALATFDDEMHELGMFIFVDARDDEHYQEARIQGAYQLDHYRSEEYLPELIPVAMGSDRIVIYCNGGDCEDSIFAANDLIDAGVPYDNIYVYEGGIAEWQAKGAPVESGSGDDE